MQRPDLPEAIGPHEGRELELMLSGKKPLAMFSDIVPSAFLWPDEDFAPHVASGKIVKREFETKTPDGRHTVRHLYFALPDEAWRIEEAHALSLLHFESFDTEAIQASIRIGLLLGYSHEDIRTFIEWVGQNRQPGGAGRDGFRAL